MLFEFLEMMKMENIVCCQCGNDGDGTENTVYCEWL